MNLHEYQAKSLIRKYGVPVLSGYLAHTPREAQKAYVNLASEVAVIKAQVHAGGRGKAGGVKLVKSSDEAHRVAEEILGMRLVTPQTGADGKLVSKVWVESGALIAREFYLSLLVDRAQACVAFIVSAQGGMEIEELALRDPDKILNVKVAFESGLREFHCRKIAAFLGCNTKAQASKLSKVLHSLYEAFCDLDGELLEINPLIETTQGDFICLDAKMSIDDNALFRQREAYAYLDYDEVDSREIRAGEVGISYVALDGNIGCMVNGAGLAMATMDMIKQAGGEPANFLDVGGGATTEMVTQAFTLILQDKSVRGVLVNIFGGIMRCDVIAAGIIEAATMLRIGVPVVVRMQGTNVAIGRDMLAKSGLDIITAEAMDEAAQKIVRAVADREGLATCLS